MSLADAAAFVVAHWSLDEASGTRNDSVGSSHLTDNNTVGSTTGKFGSAANFERDNTEYLSCASNSTLQCGDIKFMLRCWVKAESLPSSHSIMAKDSQLGGSRDYTLDFSTTTLRFYIDGGGGGKQVDWSAPLSTETWYLIHAWHDSAANQVGICVNAGTAVTTNTAGAVPPTSTSEFRIGARVYLSVEDYFDGLIDDALLMKGYILDATERTADYNGGAGVAFTDWTAVVPQFGIPLRGGMQVLTGGAA